MLKYIQSQHSSQTLAQAFSPIKHSPTINVCLRVNFSPDLDLPCRKFQGFGFVEYEDVRDADEAVRGLDGNAFGGRTITVRNQ